MFGLPGSNGVRFSCLGLVFQFRIVCWLAAASFVRL